LLRRHGVRPKKSLGQNFLTDERALARIVAAADIDSEDTVLEIGPGVGSLTRHLAQAARRVIAIEIDHQLIPVLQQVLADHSHVEVLQGDFLDMHPAHLVPPITPPASLKVVANIPYYITAPILRRLLESEPRPSLAVLTVQREVAERICAEPGDMSLLAVSVQFYGRPRIVAHIPAGAFYPPPEVDSAVVRIDLFESPAVEVASVDRFFRIVQAGFRQKRKQLKNARAGGLALPAAQAAAALRAAEVDPSRRAETLSLEEWARVDAEFARSHS
jgi:16S rRNA (adenine1518-N6/adenine1519-N6)-dimethyltransferase